MVELSFKRWNQLAQWRSNNSTSTSQREQRFWYFSCRKRITLKEILIKMWIYTFRHDGFGICRDGRFYWSSWVQQPIRTRPCARFLFPFRVERLLNGSLDRKKKNSSRHPRSIAESINMRLSSYHIKMNLLRCFHEWRGSINFSTRIDEEIGHLGEKPTVSCVSSVSWLTSWANQMSSFYQGI